MRAFQTKVKGMFHHIICTKGTNPFNSYNTYRIHKVLHIWISHIPFLILFQKRYISFYNVPQLNLTIIMKEQIIVACFQKQFFLTHSIHLWSKPKDLFKKFHYKFSAHLQLCASQRFLMHIKAMSHICIKTEWRVSVVIFDGTYFMFCLVLLCQKICYYNWILYQDRKKISTT